MTNASIDVHVRVTHVDVRIHPEQNHQLNVTMITRTEVWNEQEG